MPDDVLLPLAASATDLIERWAPVVLLAVAGFIAYLRHRDRANGPDEDEDDDLL